MGNVVAQSEKLNLPEEIARKLKGKKLELLEVKKNTGKKATLILSGLPFFSVDPLV